MNNKRQINRQQVTKIEIEGYKSIEEASIDLGMINVLIGSNGSGKSNFISLFRLLQNIVEGKLQYYTAKHGGPNTFLYFGIKQTEKMSAKFLFGNNGYGFSLVPTADNRMMFDTENFYRNTSVEQQIGNGYFESEFMRGTGTDIDDYIVPILRDQKWRVYHFHDTGDTAPMKQIQGLNDNAELAADARNLAPFLYRLQQKAPKNYTRIRDAVRMVTPFFDDFELRPNPLKTDTIQLEWKEIDSDVPFLASQLSDGTLRFICLATLLLQPQSMIPETILIDEPELGLHPYAIEVLASLMKSCSVNTQIIISTQSVELLNQFEAKDVIVVSHEHNHSEFRRLDEKNLQYWLENDYTLGDLWKRNVIGGRP